MHLLKKLIYVIALMMLAACLPREPVRIIITPTPQPATSETDVTAQVAEVATEVVASPVQTEIASTTVPTLSGDVIPVVEAQPTNTPGAQPTVGNEEADGPFGAIIDEEYTPPPTFTPQPTITPTLQFTPIPVPQLDGNVIGVQLDANKDRDTWFQLMVRTKQLGVTWIKVQADWSALQPDGPADFGPAFRLFQLNIEQAKKDGFKVMISVAKAPPWARSSTVEAGPPDDPQLLGNFLAFMLEAVKPEWVDAIEIWNEPNLHREWAGTIPFSGEGYMQLFGPAYGAIKGVAPDIQVIAAALAPTGGTPGLTIDDRVFLQQMYDAGFAQFPDVVLGIHPYGWGNPPDERCCDEGEDQFWDDDPHFFFLDTIDAYRRIIAENGDAGRRMWITELGWATWEGLPEPAPDVWMDYNSTHDQQVYTLRAFEMAQQADDIDVMILWNLNFGNSLLIENRVELVAYSLFIDGLPVRPLYYSLSRAIRGEENAVRP